MIRTQQVADMIGCSTTTVRRYCDIGMLSCKRLPSGVRIFSEEDVEAFMKQMMVFGEEEDFVELLEI